MAAGIWRRALLGLVLTTCASAASVSFSDCTSPSLNNTPNGYPTLQWITHHVEAIFDPSSAYNLNLTVYGNITGVFPGEQPPPPLPNGNNFSSEWHSYWQNNSITPGKIINLGPGTDSLTTLFASWSVASNTIQSQAPQDFCQATGYGCPLIPALSNMTGDELPSFNISQPLGSSYAFSTINTEFYVAAGDPLGTHILCVQVDVTPYIGTAPAALVRYLPVMVLVLVAIATASAVFSPWGTWNIYDWTSNYGRDADQLRLITPGFGDCLGYIQFAVLSGSLSLSYPGFFQPVVSQLSWSTLMFNQSFVSHDPGLSPVADGVYSLHRNSSSELSNLSTMRQIIGMGANYDIWAGFMVWLLVIIGVLILLIQIGTLMRVLWLWATRTQEEDLRRKNWPFSVGNVIRVVFNYFFLPLVSFCIYQMYLAAAEDDGQNFLVGLATLTLVILLCFAGWLLYQILSTQPRAYLFDDLPTVLLYGPLYNTYSDDAAPFALVPIFVNVLRGIAIGGLQVSGIAQIVLLAIAEVLVILTLNAFRPFSSPTSMNLYHTAFSVVRIVVVLLSVAFVPALQAPPGSKTIIGYVILFLHAGVLFIGFFLHSLQTLVEVTARALGAGAGGEGVDATRGGLVKVFGVRQLSRRNPRRSGRARGSMGSEAAMLHQDAEGKSVRADGMRSRSMSASSGLLLQSRLSGSQNLAMDTLGHGTPMDPAASSTGHTPGTPSGAPSMLSFTPTQSQSGFDRRASNMTAMAAAGAAGALAAAKTQDTADPFYRPPRQRRATNEAMASPGGRSRGSWHSSDWAKRASANGSEDASSEGVFRDAAGTPSPAYLGHDRTRSDSAADDPSTPKPDYATREVDYYYGVRGPALNDQPTRKLKTGPADPTGPVSSATGWFRNIFGGKSKDKHKGFEVVRGRGVKQGAMEPVPVEDVENNAQEPYHDEPGTVVAATSAPRKLDLEDEADAIGAGTRRIPGEEPEGLGIKADETPVLPEIDAGESLHIPSRIGSRASRAAGNSVRYRPEDAPALPRHTSTRSTALRPAPSTPTEARQALPIIEQSPGPSPENAQRTRNNFTGMSSDLMGGDRGLSRMPFGSLSTTSGETSRRDHERTVSAVSDVTIEGTSSASPGREMADFRRGSIGYVSQHRASDHIVTQPEILGGSTAELVDEGSVTGTDWSRTASPPPRGAPHINF